MPSHERKTWIGVSRRRYKTVESEFLEIANIIEVLRVANEGHNNGNNLLTVDQFTLSPEK